MGRELSAFYEIESAFTDSRRLFRPLDTTNQELDKDIEAEEVEKVIQNLNKNSKTSDGIGACTVKAILPAIIGLLLTLINHVFRGGINAYPSCWVSFINAIPKKGRS